MTPHTTSIKRTLELFSTPGFLIEIRALNCWDRSDDFTCTRIGNFDHDHLAEAASAVAELETTWHASGIYITLNPIPSGLLARSANRIRKSKKDESTKDAEITSRRWMLIDFDPVRPAGISSSAAELQAAESLARDVGIWLCDHGFPLPVIAMSGNGFHLLLRIDLPRDDGELVKRCLKSLNQHFGSATIKVDEEVWNPSRITKVYSTLTRKGDATEDRPHRRSELIEVPEELQIVPQERLEWLASQFVEPAKPSHTPSTNGSSDQLDVEAYLARHHVEILSRDTTADGANRWFIPCPQESLHTTKTNPRDCCITQTHTGALGGKCFHSSCGIRDWQSIKAAIGPIKSDDFPKSATADRGNTTTQASGATSSGKSILPSMSITCLNNVTPEKLKWMWYGVIPQGKITLLTGDPGLGKSFVTLDVTSRVSRGDRWPNDVLKTQSGAVILFAAEDDISDTIRPRLDAAGADVSNVFAINGVNHTDIKSGKVTTWSFQLDRDLPILVSELERLKAEGVTVRLIVIDPISCYMGKSDSHNNAEVRGTLAPLAELAATYKVAVLLISHLNKSGTGKAVYRTSGSLAFAAAARSVWVVVRDLDEPKRRMMLPVKMNLCEEPHGLAYSIQNGVVVWEADPVEMTGDEFLAKESERLRKPQTTEENSELARAETWLKTELANGAVLSTVLKKDAKENDITEATLRRAFKSLDGKAVKDGETGKWSWTLPKQDVQESLPDNVERLEHVEHLAFDDDTEGAQGAQDAQDNQARDVEHVAAESTETEDSAWI